MARRILVLTIVLAFGALSGPTAFATGAGGWDHVSTGSTPALGAAVHALNTDNPGSLYAGGAFLNAGGYPNADYLARWDGSSWHAVNGSHTLNGSVDAIAYSAGHVYVGGQFTNVAGNTGINYLAEWTGTSWKSPCAGINPITAHVAALQIIGNTLYVGGAFANGGNVAAADFLVACDLTTGAASATVPNDGDFNSGVLALTADTNGTLYAGGGFINLEGNLGWDHVAYYSGGTWHEMGAGQAVNDFVRSLTAHGTSVYVGTDAVDINGIAQADHIARWDAQNLAFSAVGSNSAGTNGWFNSSAFLYGMTTTGSLLFVGGSFQNANGQATADEIAYFNGSSWHPLGSNGAGNGPLNGTVQALATIGHAVYAGGNFTNAGADGLADYLASHAILRPDARIGASASGPFIGSNVYSATGSGEAKTIKIPRGRSGSLYVNIQNDGLTPDFFTVIGPVGSQGFALTYFHNGSNVTSQIHAGTFSTATLAVGSQVTIRVAIKVAATSASGAAYAVTARSRSGTPHDAVRVVVRAT